MTAAEACTLLAKQAQATSAARADAEQLKTWLRAAMRALIVQNRDIDRLRADLQREQRQHRDLREETLLRREAA